MILLRVISWPFRLIAIMCVLLIYGSDQAEKVADSYREFFSGL